MEDDMDVKLEYSKAFNEMPLDEKKIELQNLIRDMFSMHAQEIGSPQIEIVTHNKFLGMYTRTRIDFLQISDRKADFSNVTEYNY